MTVALAAALGAVVVALALTEVALMRARRQVDVEHRQVADFERRLAEAVDIAAVAVTRSEEAGRTAEALRRRAEVAERRVEEEVRWAETANQRAEAAESRAELAETRSRAGESLVDLEGVRLGREWSDLVGPGVPLPAAWDGGVAAAIVTELAIIREIVGTPSEVAIAGHPGVRAPGEAAALMRLCSEVLRALARSGEEMVVKVRAAGFTVEQPSGAPAPDLSHIAEIARHVGAELSVQSSADGNTTELRFPVG